jgi:hypothetical protein
MKKKNFIFPYCIRIPFRQNPFSSRHYIAPSEEEMKVYKNWLDECVNPENYRISKDNLSIEFADENDLTMFTLRFGMHEKTLSKLEKMILHENSLEQEKNYK